MGSRQGALVFWPPLPSRAVRLSFRFRIRCIYISTLGAPHGPSMQLKCQPYHHAQPADKGGVLADPSDRRRTRGQGGTISWNQISLSLSLSLSPRIDSERPLLIDPHRLIRHHRRGGAPPDRQLCTQAGRVQQRTHAVPRPLERARPGSDTAHAIVSAVGSWQGPADGGENAHIDHKIQQCDAVEHMAQEVGDGP
jgi:hypothetical protein